MDNAPMLIGWTYSRNPESTRWIIDSAPAHAIACTAGYACDDENIARLIAAAPDLLEALQDCAAGLAYVKQHYGELAGVGFERALSKADAAIAKATQ